MIGNLLHLLVLRLVNVQLFFLEHGVVRGVVLVEIGFVDHTLAQEVLDEVYQSNALQIPVELLDQHVFRLGKFVRLVAETRIPLQFCDEGNFFVELY